MSALGEIKFMTVEEIASAMRVSKMTVYRMVTAGELPGVKVGRQIRIPERAVLDYIGTYLGPAFLPAGH